MILFTTICAFAASSAGILPTYIDGMNETVLSKHVNQLSAGGNPYAGTKSFLMEFDEYL